MLTRSRALLDREGHSWAKLQVEGRDLELSGNAPSPEARDLALQAVNRVFGMRDVIDATTLAPEAVPFVFKLQRRDGKWLLSGYVPAEEVRKTLASAILAIAPGAEIVDTTVLARGLPVPQFMQYAQYLIAIGGHLESGEVGLADRTVWGSGQSTSPKDLAAITALKVPDGVRATVTDIIPPAAVPFAWFADIRDGRIALSGVAPSEAIRSEIAADIRQVTPTAALSDSSTIASGAPVGFRDIARFAIRHLADFETGRMVIADGTVHVTGKAASIAAYHRITEALQSEFPSVATLGSVDITPADVFPTVWVARRDPGRVVLSGFVPSTAVRKAIVTSASALLPGSRIIDQTELAANAPDGLAEQAGFALRQLAALERGSVTLFGHALAIEGQASTVGDVEAVTSNLIGDVPGGLTVKSVNIAPAVAQPYSLRVAVSPTAVRVTGVVPSQAALAEVMSGVKLRFPGREVVTGVRLAAGEPDGFRIAIGSALAIAADLDEGLVTIAEGKIHVSGTAASPESAARLAHRTDRPETDSWTVATLEVKPPTVLPYTFKARFDGMHLALTGVVPSGTVGRSLAALAKETVPFATVSDLTSVAAGDPPGFADGARFALARLASLGEGTAVVTGTDVHIDGEAKTVSTQRAIASDLSAPPLGFVVRTALVRPPRVADWVFTLTRDGTSLTLGGYVPDKEVRGRIAAAAAKAFAGVHVEDQLELATGGPDGLQSAAEFGLAQLARLESAQVTIDWNGYSISGRPKDYATYQDLVTPLQANAVPGLRTGRIDLRAPIPSPYVFALQRSGNAVQLTGYVPNAGSRGEVIAAIGRQLGDVRISDQLTITPGAPEMFAEAIVAGLSGASRLQDGQVEFADSRLSVKGGAYFASSVTSAQDQIAERLPKGYSADTSAIALLPPPPQVSVAQCELGMRQAARTQAVRFEPAKATLKPESFGVLDEVAFAALRCVNARIKVEGHTDSDGDEESNIKLSEARARAVAAYLARTGIANDRLIVEGFGSSRPVASNETLEGKLQNRRIEFRVVEQ